MNKEWMKNKMFIFCVTVFGGRLFSILIGNNSKESIKFNGQLLWLIDILPIVLHHISIKYDSEAYFSKCGILLCARLNANMHRVDSVQWMKIFLKHFQTSFHFVLSLELYTVYHPLLNAEVNVCIWNTCYAIASVFLYKQRPSI